MRHDYARCIHETEAELRALERRHRGSPAGDRVKMLRLLKSGAFTSRSDLSGVLGYSERQLQRWWLSYRQSGLRGLLAYEKGGGRRERLPEEALDALRSAFASGEVVLLKEAQNFLHTRFDVRYASLQGVADLMRRHGITARPRAA